ncbi:hypothetical protein BaRGS_00007445 [Batillaria attramentaria]|uniref:Uncharacterized protein n=1 Tax=Batillaria attramentaria TaxID=370345 RepID=A0ABD0LP58_9CAEN
MHRTREHDFPAAAWQWALPRPDPDLLGKNSLTQDSLTTQPALHHALHGLSPCPEYFGTSLGASRGSVITNAS